MNNARPVQRRQLARLILDVRAGMQITPEHLEGVSYEPSTARALIRAQRLVGHEVLMLYGTVDGDLTFDGTVQGNLTGMIRGDLRMYGSVGGDLKIVGQIRRDVTISDPHI